MRGWWSQAGTGEGQGRVEPANSSSFLPRLFPLCGFSRGLGGGRSSVRRSKPAFDRSFVQNSPTIGECVGFLVGSSPTLFDQRAVGVAGRER